MIEATGYDGPPRVELVWDEYRPGQAEQVLRQNFATNPQPATADGWSGGSLTAAPWGRNAVRTSGAGSVVSAPIPLEAGDLAYWRAKVWASAPVSVQVLGQSRPSRNLVNPAELMAGYTLNTTTGAPAASATYTLTGFIPVVAGQSYAISNPRNVCFYNPDQSHRGLAEVVNNPTSGPIVVTAVVNGFLRASYVTASYGSTFQVEQGGTHTAYEPYGTVPGGPVEAASTGPVALTRTGDAITLGSKLGSSSLVINAHLKWTTNGGFNINHTTLDGALIHGNSNGDEVTPIRTQMGTVGANHGYPTATRTFANPDGKTAADVGSVWTDGTREYVLLAVNSDGRVVMGGSYTVSAGVVSCAAVNPTSNLTHVSGATHTGTVVAATSATQQLYPSVGSMSVTLWCDGVQITGNATTSGQTVEVRESYEILDYKSLYDLAKANVGTHYSTLPVEGAVRMENTFRFTAGGACRVSTKITVLKKTTFGATGMLQSVRLSRSGMQTIRHMPGVKAKGGHDFGTGVDLDAYSSSLIFTADDMVDPTMAPPFTMDRLIESGTTKLGFALGFDPFTVADSSSATRATATPANVWDMRSTDKSYPTVINGVTLDPGATIAGDGYRAYLAPQIADLIAAAGRDIAPAWELLDATAVGGPTWTPPSGGGWAELSGWITPTDDTYRLEVTSSAQVGMGDVIVSPTVSAYFDGSTPASGGIEYRYVDGVSQEFLPYIAPGEPWVAGSIMTITRTAGDLSGTVRGATRRAATVTGFIVDWEAPVGVPITYLLEAWNPDGVRLASVSVTVDPLAEPQGSKIWLSDPLVEGSAREVVSLQGTDAERKYPQEVSRVYPAGQRYGASSVTQRRGIDEWPLVLFAKSAEEARELRTMIMTAASLCVRVPAWHQLDPIMYGQYDGTETFSPRQSDIYSMWSGNLLTSVGPGLDVVVASRTYEDVESEHTSYASIITTYDTYTDLQRGQV